MVNWTANWDNTFFGQSFDDYYLGSPPIQDPVRPAAPGKMFSKNVKFRRNSPGSKDTCSNLN